MQGLLTGMPTNLNLPGYVEEKSTRYCRQTGAYLRIIIFQFATAYQIAPGTILNLKEFANFGQT